MSVLVECGRVQARVGVGWWWFGVMEGRRSAEKWMGETAHVRAVQRCMSGERKVRGWAGPAAEGVAVPATGAAILLFV